MSRGLGWKQRFLFRRLKHQYMTFAEIHREIIGPDHPDFMLTPIAERSWRRALHKLVKNDWVITTGRGSRGYPHRYHLNPLIVAMTGDKEFFETVVSRIPYDRSISSPPWSSRAGLKG